MDVANQCRENYQMNFMAKYGTKIECNFSYIPVYFCEFPDKELILVVVYGFGMQPILLKNLDRQKKNCVS